MHWRQLVFACAIYALAAFSLVDIRDTRAQTDIIAISSFRSCLQLDPSITGDSGVGSLNCSKVNNQVPPVTTLDLSVTPGLSDGSSFNIDITTVLDNQNAPNTTTNTATECDPADPQTQMCFSTKTAQLTVNTSKPVFKYALRREEGFDLPYCYVSTVEFSQLWTGGTDVGCHASLSWSDHCDSTTSNNQQSTDHALMCALQSKNSITQSNTNRFQVPFPSPSLIPGTYLRGCVPKGVADCDNDDTAAYAFPFYADTAISLLRPDGSGPTLTPQDIECKENRCQGNVYNPAPSPGSTFVFPYCCYNTGQESCDSRNVDTRVPAYRPWPNPFGRAAEELYDTTNVAESTYVRNDSIPGQTVWLADNSDEHTYSRVHCSSPRCAANRDNRRQLFEFDGDGEGLGTQFVETQHAILAVPPTCTAYRVNPKPEVIIQVNISIETTDPAGDNQTQVLSINNFRQGSSQSSDLKLLRASIRNIQKTNAALGPSIDGYIVVCGRQAAKTVPDMIDMRYLVPRDKGVPIEDIPVTHNPWPYIIDQYNKDRVNPPTGNERKYYFPHPFDYVNPGLRGKSADGVGLGDDYGQTLWFFVPQDIALREWGTGCNQVGMRGAWTNAAPNQAQLCRLPPHACTPGIGDFTNGGRKESVPCTVSGLFNLASGALGDDARTNLAPNSIFDRSVDDAIRFMPGDTFFAQVAGSQRAKTAPLYDPTAPNAWLAQESLIFEQSGSASIDDSINVELVIDFLGSFVAYEERVSKGEIELAESSLNCKLKQGDTAVVGARVKNLALITNGVATTYRLALTCNTDVSGLEVVTPAQAVGPLLPQSTSDIIEYTLNQDASAAQKAQCEFTLSSETDVVIDPVMDRKGLPCNIRPIPPPPIIEPPNSTDSPVLRPPCEGACKRCYWLQGTVYEDWCSMIVIILILIALAFIVVAPLVGISERIYSRTQSQRDAAETDDVYDQYMTQDSDTEHTE